MLIQRLQTLIKNQNIDKYQIRSKKEKSFQVFYVLQNLETARIVESEIATVTLYKDNNETLGEATFTCNGSYTDEELTEMIIKTYARCNNIQNKPFPLPEKQEISYKYNKYIDADEEKLAFDIAKAVFKADKYQEGWINSTEIYVTKEKRAFVNSNGMEASYEWFNIFIEMIPTWKGQKEEVELYFALNTSDVDLNKITSMVDDKLMDAKKRGEAITIPDLKEVNCILGIEEAKQIFKMIASNASYSDIYRHMNHYEKGQMIQQGNECDKMTVTLTGYIDSSDIYAPIDRYGTVLNDIKIIEDGQLTNQYGDCKYGHYLNAKVTGDFPNVLVNPGSKSFEEEAKKPYLLCKDFSAFQLDPYSGYYGGEVRLAIYFDGEKETAVTGFTVSGNIYEDLSHMYFSKNVDNSTFYQGPKYIFVKMSVNK